MLLKSILDLISPKKVVLRRHICFSPTELVLLLMTLPSCMLRHPVSQCFILETARKSLSSPRYIHWRRSRDGYTWLSLPMNRFDLLVQYVIVVDLSLILLLNISRVLLFMLLYQRKRYFFVFRLTVEVTVSFWGNWLTSTISHCLHCHELRLYSRKILIAGIAKFIVLLVHEICRLSHVVVVIHLFVSGIRQFILSCISIL